MPMPEVQMLFMLTVAVTVLVLVARRMNQPYPILLVLGGLLLGFVPGIPRIDLHAEMVFLVFLPPLLFVDSLNTSWRDFRRNLLPILRLSIVLVVVTASAVALVAHALVPEITWPVAFVLGAVVAPTDPVALEAIAERLHLPRRIATILKGESLVNDASSIVIYRIALGVVLGGVFSLGTAVGTFALVSLGGVLVGLAVGWGMGKLQKALPEEPAIEITVSLLTPLTAYLPAEGLHVSGVLAVVTCGMYLGHLNPRIVSARTRLQSTAVWQMITFLLNGLLFLLVGLQLRRIVADLPPRHPIGELLLVVCLISLTVVLTRILWSFAAIYLPSLLLPARFRSKSLPDWRQVALVAWSGIRGGISLAVALAIPLTTGGTDAATAAKPFPARDEILFVTFGVILFTLIVQGLSLPALIRALGITRDGKEGAEELQARLRIYTSVLDHWQTRAQDETIPPMIYAELNRFYTLRQKHLKAYADTSVEPGVEQAQPSGNRSNGIEDYVRLRRELLIVEREMVLSLRDGAEISDETLHRIQKDQDLDEARLESLRESLPGEG